MFPRTSRFDAWNAREPRALLSYERTSYLSWVVFRTWQVHGRGKTVPFNIFLFSFDVYLSCIRRRVYSEARGETKECLHPSPSSRSPLSVACSINSGVSRSCVLILMNAFIYSFAYVYIMYVYIHAISVVKCFSFENRFYRTNKRIAIWNSSILNYPYYISLLSFVFFTFSFYSPSALSVSPLTVGKFFKLLFD